MSMTEAEQFVLARFPDAFCHYDEPDFAILRRSSYKALGRYKLSAIAAWADAANNIEQAERKP